MTLREALESHGCVSAPHDEDDFVDECGVCVIDAAARRFLALTETGQRVERCTTHDADVWVPSEVCWVFNFIPAQRDRKCSVVPVFVVPADYLTEEDTDG